ncbi:MAG: MOSC domain-containing protein [Saprospiraceae bacterium]|nr:MOSC domain-containing protein [Saprospiraceae bacterium]
MLCVSDLFIYPIKSLAGISVQAGKVTERGFEYDRRWLLVDSNNSFLTLRKYPSMSLIQPSLQEDGMTISTKAKDQEDLFVPFLVDQELEEEVTIWNATCLAQVYSDKVNQWFGTVIGTPCKLVFMPDHSWRPVDTTSGFKPKGKFTSFADAYPFMMMSRASLADIDRRTKLHMSFARFRPNIVFQGGIPYQEDEMERFEINGIQFTGLEKCARCNVPNVDPETAQMDPNKETIKTLASYRLENGKVNLGMNLVHEGEGTIKVGDELKIIQ